MGVLWLLPAWSESEGCWHSSQLNKTDPGLAGCLRSRRWWGTCFVHLWPPEHNKLCYYCLFDAISEISDLWPNTCRVMVISSWVSKPRGLCFLLELSKVMDTVALVIPARPFLYTRSWRLVARTYNVWQTKTSSITAFEVCNSHLFIY